MNATPDVPETGLVCPLPDQNRRIVWSYALRFSSRCGDLRPVCEGYATEADRLTAAHRAGDPTASERLAVLLGVWWRTERASLIAELARRAQAAGAR